jgi:hypothetical protein
MSDPVFISCEPYEREIYRVETDQKETREIIGFYVRVYDSTPNPCVPFVECAGRFIAVGPRFKDLPLNG